MWQKKVFVPEADSMKVTRQSFELEGKVGDLNSFSREEISHVGGLNSVSLSSSLNSVWRDWIVKFVGDLRSPIKLFCYYRLSLVTPQCVMIKEKEKPRTALTHRAC